MRTKMASWYRQQNCQENSSACMHTCANVQSQACLRGISSHRALSAYFYILCLIVNVSLSSSSLFLHFQLRLRLIMHLSMPSLLSCCTHGFQHAFVVISIMNSSGAS